MLGVGRQHHPVPCPTKPWRSRIAVPDVPPAVVRGGHVAVQIVGWSVLTWRRGGAEDVGVLVQGIGKIRPTRAVVGGRQAVPYRIVGVVVSVRPHESPDDFRTDVVPEVVRHVEIIHS